MLELVVANDAIPELMPGFVDRDSFWICDVTRGQPASTSGKDRRVLHPPSTTLPGWVDHGHVVVGIGAEPLSEVLERVAGGADVSRRLVDVLRLEQQSDVDTREVGVLELLLDIDEVRADRPGEVVHILLIVVMGRRAVLIVRDTPLYPRRTQDPVGRYRHPDVIDAVVSKELGSEMELMAVPSCVFKDANLGKPLREEKVVAHVAGPSKCAWHSRRPLELDAHDIAWLDRTGQRDSKDGLVVSVAIVRGNVVRARGQVDRSRVARVEQANGRDIDPAPVVGGAFVQVPPA